jgi:hypothetical protein
MQYFMIYYGTNLKTYNFSLATKSQGKIRNWNDLLDQDP